MVNMVRVKQRLAFGIALLIAGGLFLTCQALENRIRCSFDGAVLDGRRGLPGADWEFDIARLGLPSPAGVAWPNVELILDGSRRAAFGELSEQDLQSLGADGSPHASFDNGPRGTDRVYRLGQSQFFFARGRLVQVFVRGWSDDSKRIALAKRGSSRRYAFPLSRQEAESLFGASECKTSFRMN
jgi:hypothetical protein